MPSDKVHDLFDQALDLPADQREDFLRRACGDDHALASAVRELLAAHERAQAGRFLAEPVVPGERLFAPGLTAAGARIGPYTLFRVLGEGGYGTVYEAEQREPLRRRV